MEYRYIAGFPLNHAYLRRGKVFIVVPLESRQDSGAADLINDSLKDRRLFSYLLPRGALYG